ncbi:MFS transporter [Undibacterium sp. SXout20W]|uniref:MFS transporter n=1 Tax=Undibacterium sp. SXout20W TaxID=3413051 RepID=UPI003BF55B4D
MNYLNFSRLVAYGLLAFPLAFVALPIYVYVPQFYAEHFGISLSAIGSALLVSRIADAFFDPLIGGLIDRRPAGVGYERYIIAAIPLLIGGFVALFHPMVDSGGALFAWFFASLIVVYAGFSLASIAYQAWGAALTQSPGERLRISAVRESCGLLGVLSAALMGQLASFSWLSWLLATSLLISAACLLRWTPRIYRQLEQKNVALAWSEMFMNMQFRRLFTVFVLNGIAAAIPATLFLFFTKDRMHLGAQSGYLLLIYFLAAAVSMPFWIAFARKTHERDAWLLSMLTTIISFIWAYNLPADALVGFGLICVFTGFSLGADLALPPALLAAVINHAGHSEKYEGSYFGAWSWAGKMNLALAAGLALPLLDLLGYQPGGASPGGLQALGYAYAILPCGLKCVAAWLLWRSPLRSL